MVFHRFPELAKLLEINAFLRWCFSQGFRRFTRVAARLLHRGYRLHPHKVRDDRYSTSRLAATSSSFVFGEFSEDRPLPKERSSSPD
jgi:hypothetical protein